VNIKPERLDVTREELEAILEGVRVPLCEVSYQKLQAAIRTLNYVTELLETREATLEKFSSTRGRWSRIRGWEWRYLTYSNTGIDLLCFCDNREPHLIIIL